MSLEQLKEVVSGLTGLDASELTLSHQGSELANLLGLEE